MRDPLICKTTDHLFLPVLEVHDALLRCIHCNVFAYQETVKELAKRRAYTVDRGESVPAAGISGIGRIWRRWREAWTGQAGRFFGRGLRIESKLR